MSETEAELRAEIERLRAELDDRSDFVSRVMDAEDQARRRIAQLIHDDALQSLLAAHQELIEAAPGRAGVTRAHEVVSGSIANLREALVALHPVTLEQGGLDQAIGAIARQAERQGGFEVTVELDPAAFERNDELMLAVARELLANATQHSGARAVTITLTARDAELVLEVADDGRGMGEWRPRDALAAGHIGLASVAQRVAAADGRFEVDSEPGAGTRARVTVPG